MHDQPLEFSRSAPALIFGFLSLFKDYVSLYPLDTAAKGGHAVL